MRPYPESRIVSPSEIVDKPQGYAMASMMFRSEIIRKLPKYYVNCPVGDTPLQLMAAATGYGYYMDQDMSVYRLGAAVSWTSQGKLGDYEAKQERYCRQMEETFTEFDRVTGGRFHKEAERAARRIWYLTKVNTKKYDVVMDKQYRDFFKELTPRTRFYIRFEVCFPRVYEILAKIARARQS